MQRMPPPKHRGKRELLYIALLVVPLVVAGFFFASTGDLIESVPTSVPIEATPEATPAATPLSTPVGGT